MDERARLLGVETGYRDAFGKWRDAPASTVRAIVEGMESRGAPHHPQHARHRRGREATCPSPPGRAWGWSAQLYAARSSASWGIGDLADLRLLAAEASRSGARFLLVNPLNPALAVVPQEPSPYFPSTRLFRNPLYLRVEEVPGAADVDGIDGLARQGRALNARRPIDRDEVWRLKIAAVERLWDRFRGGAAFDAWRSRQGEELERFAVFCVLTEEHGARWSAWPGNVRRPDGAGVRRVAGERRDRVLFHVWLQWLLEEQLAAASGAGAGLVYDLAVGFDPAGADAWAWQDCLALDMRVGAPPDAFNADGQDWGFPPFDPWSLQAAGYEPFRQTCAAAMAHGIGVRIDHVMGLFRLFWIPNGADPTEGTYVNYPSGDLLSIVATEAGRAETFVVGEDLGTVEPEVREELRQRGILSYRLLWFEANDPSQWPVESLGAVTTHDLPTIAGVWRGSDGSPEMRDRLREVTGLSEGAPVAEVVEAVYGRLGVGASALVAATLEDALGVEERPNRPAIDDPRNWSLALPLPLEDLVADGRVARVAAALRRSRRE